MRCYNLGVDALKAGGFQKPPALDVIISKMESLAVKEFSVGLKITRTREANGYWDILLKRFLFPNYLPKSEKTN